MDVIYICPVCAYVGRPVQSDQRQPINLGKRVSREGDLVCANCNSNRIVPQESAPGREMSTMHGLQLPAGYALSPDVSKDAGKGMGRMKIPASPEELVTLLSTIFPAFRLDGRNGDSVQSGSLTFHSVMLAFTPYFGRAAHSCSENQLRTFGTLLNEAIRQSGPLENAISTCFLDHLRQIRVEKVLRPFLAPEGKERTHA